MVPFNCNVSLRFSELNENTIQQKSVEIIKSSHKRKIHSSKSEIQKIRKSTSKW